MRPAPHAAAGPPLNAGRTALWRLLRGEDGAVAPMICIMALVLLGTVGLAIDTGRSTLVRARLVDALDSAGLAVGARLATTDYTADATKFVAANLKANYAGATVTEVTATANASQSVITLTATAVVPTAFMRLFGIDTVTVKTMTEVTRASAGLELALALDTTGSMHADMPTLKSAAKSLVEIVLAEATVSQNVFVGVVPFSQAVNVGYPTHKHWFDADHAKTQVPEGYQSLWPSSSTGCAEARLSGLDQTDDIPDQKKKATLLHYYLVPYKGSADQASINKWIADKEFARGCPQTSLPMTPVKSKIMSAIDGMAAEGNTHVNLGAVWAWRMLSPKWRGFWAGDMATHKLPLDYGTRNMTKATVIMTDGANTMTNEIYTAHGELKEGRLGTTDPAAAVTALNTRLTNVCSKMKAAGVVVYTVAFRNPGATIKNLLQGCATKAEFYFDSATADALKNDFKTIGGSLSNLRVSR